MKKQDNQPKKPRNKRLLFRVALIVLAIFLVIILMVGTLIYHSSKTLYLEAKNDMITRDLTRIRNSVQWGQETPWMLEYCETYPDEIKAQVDEDDYRLYEEFMEKQGEVGVYFSGDTMKALKASSHDVQRAVAKTLFYLFEGNLQFEAYSVYYDELYCIDINDKNRGFVFCGVDSSTDSSDTVCETWDYPLEQHSAIREILETKLDLDKVETFFEEAKIDPSNDNNVYHIGYIPILDGKTGELCAAICIAYNWSEFRATLTPYFVFTFLIGIVIMLIAGFALLHFLHRSAIRPLKKIQEGVRHYMNDKDSGKVIAAMKEITAKNEFGVLSDDIAELADEIDRYTQENIQLVTSREKVAAELGLAAKIQFDMLPKEFIERPHLSMYASMDPAMEVGGDFYDFFMIDEDHLGMVIADVSGKGVPASLYMMMAMIVIRNYARAGKSPSEVLRKSNRSLCENNDDSMFVTVWFGVLDVNTGHVIASNAGHEYPMLRKANGEFELFKDKHGFVLGAMSGMKYKDYEFDMEEGGTLFVYTDGAPEATDADSNLFGTARMLETLNSDPDAEPKELLRNMTAAIDKFVGEAPQFDDLTMLCVKYHGNQQGDQQDNQQKE